MVQTQESQRIDAYVRLVEGVQAVHSPVDVRAALHDLVRMFDDLGVPFAVIGAYAVSVYVGEKRTTEDIDVVTPEAAIEEVRRAAPPYGFVEIPKEDDAPIRVFRHRGGARLDVIFAPPASDFADLSRANRVVVEGVGPLPVAAPADVALNKLRTQRPGWGRRPDKRSRDFADVVAMLAANATLAEDIYRRIPPPSRSKAGDLDFDLSAQLRRACEEAEVPLPMRSRRSRTPILLVITILLATLLFVVRWAVK